VEDDETAVARASNITKSAVLRDPDSRSNKLKTKSNELDFAYLV